MGSEGCKDSKKGTDMTTDNPFDALEFSHVCYVSDDFEEAARVLKSNYSATSFLELGLVEFANEQGEEIAIRIGLGCVGPSFVELIQPVSGAVDIYRKTLRESSSPMIWHHVAFAAPSQENLKEIREAHLSSGREVALSNQVGDFFYADTRPLIGHYTEYFLMDADRVALHDAVRAQ